MLHQPNSFGYTTPTQLPRVTLHQPNPPVLHYTNPTHQCYVTPTQLTSVTLHQPNSPVIHYINPTHQHYTTPTQLTSVTRHQPNSPALRYTNPTPQHYTTPTQLHCVMLKKPTPTPCVNYTNPAHRYSCCSKPACWARVAAAAGRAGCAAQREAAGTLAPAGTRRGNPTAPAPGERGTSWSGTPAPVRPGLTPGWRCPASSAIWPRGSAPGLWWKGTENGLNDCVYWRAIQIALRLSAQGLVFRICSFLETFLNELRPKNAGRHKCIYKHMHH